MLQLTLPRPDGTARSVLHYARVFELADRCGALTRPALAVERMRRFLAVSAGVEG
jgi:hypothetical protein